MGREFKPHRAHLKTQKVIQSLFLTNEERYSKEPLLISYVIKLEMALVEILLSAGDYQQPRNNVLSGFIQTTAVFPREF